MHETGNNNKGNESSSIKLTYYLGCVSAYLWWDNYVEANEIPYDKVHIRISNTGVLLLTICVNFFLRNEF